MKDSFNLEHIHIIPFYPHRYSKEDWSLYHEYRTTLHKFYHPDLELTTSDESAEKGLKMYKEHPEVDGRIYAVLDTTSNKQMGQILCVLPRKTSATYKENPGYMEFYITILPDYRRKGIGSLALKTVQQVAEEHEKTLLATDTTDPAGKAFLQKIGAELEIGIENRLQLEEIDWTMVEQWVEEGQKRSPETKIVELDSVPEEIIEEFSRIYTETHNQQSWEELDQVAFIFGSEYFRHLKKTFAETGIKWLVMITVEKDGKISGLTEMRYDPGMKTVITQELTGVKQEYRGRGLGKRLKAAMLVKIKEELPEVKTIRTENATTNSPMLSINERLGFKFFRESIEAHISIETVRKSTELEKK